MMFTSLNADCDASSRCSTASPSGESVAYYPLNQTQEFTDLSVSSASFVPTVTAISSCPDLQWMVQPMISSVAPSNGAARSYNPNLYPKMRVTGTKSPNPNKRARVEQLSPEEEEKKKIRRERNKMAAAKCRNRRRELTDTLQAETDQLEDEKSALQNDIANLLKEKERLEFILAAHKPICKMPAETSTSSISPIPAVSVPEIHSVTTSLVSTASTPVTTSSSSSLFSGTVSTDSFSSTTVRISDLEPTLEESLELLAKAELETARSVPDVDLSSSLYAQDWEPLYTPANNDLEPLCTPVVTCTPACTTYTSSFMFTYPENDVFPTCGPVHRRGGSSSNDQSSDSLNSPTLLTL
ncbi:hypothetical protein QQF64_016325 [Cirrhinus molitorella]|uniref:Protein c-Fos n=1 Tax=Cirrhinus molitorella TaxID=172907 RepID=A0ABR3LQ06_9TELE